MRLGYLQLPLVFLLSTSLVIAQVDQCQDACSNYQTILDGCQHDAGDESIYLSCVCNDDNFSSSNAACVQCEGTGSAPDQFRSNCAKVAPDCTVACSSFSTIVESCGDPSDTANFENCMCSSAYDLQNTDTFNQAFNDCAQCASGGGQALDWEQRCCAAGHGCNGLASAASSGGSSPTTTTGNGGSSASTSTNSGGSDNSGSSNSGSSGGGGSTGDGSRVFATAFVGLSIAAILLLAVML